MSAQAERFASAAETFEGGPFLLHGRNPQTGFDCVGLVALALGKAEIAAEKPFGYALRNHDISRCIADGLPDVFASVTGGLQRGDLLLVKPGPAQHHLVIALGNNRFVHAHAGLCRTVCQHGLADWPVLNHWRLRAR